MPSTSAISGWTIPLDSDPVKDGAKAVRDLVTSIEAGWTAFTPAWTGATTNPVLGNAVVVARYKRIGKTVFYRITITCGTTTTYGSGQYSMSLPFAAHASGLQLVAGDCLIGGAAYPCRGRISASGTTAVLYTPSATAGAFDRSVTNLVPATFANGSVLSVEGVYEAA